MKVTIEHSFCPYCDEVTELYFPRNGEDYKRN